MEGGFSMGFSDENLRRIMKEHVSFWVAHYSKQPEGRVCLSIVKGGSEERTDEGRLYHPRVCRCVVEAQDMATGCGSQGLLCGRSGAPGGS